MVRIAESRLRPEFSDWSDSPPPPSSWTAGVHRVDQGMEPVEESPGPEADMGGEVRHDGCWVAECQLEISAHLRVGVDAIALR